jgi:DNA polymerase (family 10)
VHEGHTQRVRAPLDNAAVAERLEAFAGLLDLAGASPYTARAYRRAAETIRETRAPIVELVRQGRVQELRGIGPGIASRLRELVETGTIAELDELQREVRPELVGLGRLLGIAPKRMVEIASVLGLQTPDDFRSAARDGRLRTVLCAASATRRGGFSITARRTRSSSSRSSTSLSSTASRSR